MKAGDPIRGGAAVAAVVVSFGILCLAAFGWPALHGGATDFRSFYAGARLAGSSQLYSVEEVRRVQQEYADPDELKAFTRPPFYALLLWPLGRLPYGMAHAFWQALNIAALAGFILLWSRSASGVLLCCWFLPLWVGFMAGQDVPLILFVVSMSTFLLGKNRHLPAGLVFALCAAKPHLFLLVPLVILAKRLWRFAAGLVAGGACLAGISVMAAGWDWPVRQLALLRLNERGEASASYMPNLYGLFHSVPHGKVLVAISTVAVVCAAWYVFRRLPLIDAIAAMLCAGLLVGMHAFLYDCAFLLPVLLLDSQREGLERVVPRWSAVGISTVTLTRPSVAFIGQAAILLFFCLLVHDASWRGRTATHSDTPT